ncbi:MAG: myosin-like coiled-coil protein-domain-containing protein, partial [Olpidium bornovanus]
MTTHDDEQHRHRRGSAACRCRDAACHAPPRAPEDPAATARRHPQKRRNSRRSNGGDEPENGGGGGDDDDDDDDDDDYGSPIEVQAARQTCAAAANSGVPCGAGSGLCAEETRGAAPKVPGPAGWSARGAETPVGATSHAVVSDNSAPAFSPLAPGASGRPQPRPPAAKSSQPVQPNQGPQEEQSAQAASSVSSASAAKSTPPAAPAQSGPAVGANGQAWKKTKKPPTADELNNMVQSRISQLETETALEDEEERALGVYPTVWFCFPKRLLNEPRPKSIRKANKEFKELVNAPVNDQSAKNSLVHQKYMDLVRNVPEFEHFHDLKRLERDNAKSKKRLEALTKERDASKAECNKALSVKAKLESLCRQLQRENKRIKEESKQLASAELQKREELSNKFERTISDIKSKMEADTDERRRRLDDNENMREKFESFLTQYELREQHFTCVLKSKDLELRLAEAKLAKQAEASGRDAAQVAELEAQIATLDTTEHEHRKQIAVYVERFKQVEDTLNKSSELFTAFRKEMEEASERKTSRVVFLPLCFRDSTVWYPGEFMTKRTRRLEKDNSMLRGKCDTMNLKILEMAEEQAKSRKTCDSIQKRNVKLENLCRALQGE